MKGRSDIVFLSSSCFVQAVVNLFCLYTHSSCSLMWRIHNCSYYSIGLYNNLLFVLVVETALLSNGAIEIESA